MASVSKAAPSYATVGASNFLWTTIDGALASPPTTPASNACMKTASSRRASPAASNALKAASLAFLNRPTTTTSCASLAAATALASLASTDAGPASLVRWDTMPAASRGPAYSAGASTFLPLNTFSVGNPFTSYFSASALLASSVASTLTSLMPVAPLSSSWAAFSYSGASVLQCPHQGA